MGWVTAGNLPSRLCLLPAARCCCAVPLQCASRVCQGLQATGISRIGPVWRHCSAPSKLPRRDATALLRTPDGIWPRRCRITGWQQDGGMGEVWEVVWNGLPDGGDGARSVAAFPPVLASIMPRQQGCQRGGLVVCPSSHQRDSLAVGRPAETAGLREHPPSQVQQPIARPHRQSRRCRVLPHDFFVLSLPPRSEGVGKTWGTPRCIWRETKGGRGGDTLTARSSRLQASGGLFCCCLSVSGVGIHPVIGQHTLHP